MDTGVAAVLGAAVGAVGAGAAALASGWLGASTAREQIVAQHLQSVLQRSFEHARDRREPRSLAYTDLIAQTQVIGTRISEMNLSEAYTEDGVQRVLAEISKFVRYRARVMIEGPEAVADSTEDLIDAVKECEGVLMALASVPGAPPEMRDKSRTELVEVCRASLEPLADALGGFVETAREALDDQGQGL